MKKNRWMDALTGFFLSLCILCGAVVITLNFSPLYRLDMKVYDISAESGYPEDEVYENYRALIAYNRIGGGEKLVLPTMPVSETASIHFAEVKRIFVAIQLAFFISLPVCILLVLLRRRKPGGGWLFITGMACGVLPLVLGGGVALNWESFFIGFHELVFDNDYWLFDPAEDPVILILPDGYFMHCAVMILCIWLAAGIICFILWNRRKALGEVK